MKVMPLHPTLDDITIYLVGGDLTTNGIQYSDEKTTTDADTDYTIFEYTFEPDEFGGKFVWVYFNLTATLKAGSATADVKMKMQARNKGGTWQDLFSQVTYTDINTAYLDKTYEGYLIENTDYITPGDADLWTYFNEVPFDLRVQIQSNETTPGVGYGKMKNTSLIRVITRRDVNP